MPKIQKITVGNTQAVNVRVNTGPATNKTVKYNNTNGIAQAVNVRVNTGPATKKTVQYTNTFSVINAKDVEFLNAANNLSVLTYDDVTDKFLVQNVPRLNGGTF